MREVAIPAVGFAMSEAVLVRWIMQPGQAVEVGSPIAEIETDKAIVDLESPASGVLGRHRFVAGDVVPVGTALTVVLEDDENEGDDRTNEQIALLETAESGTTAESFDTSFQESAGQFPDDTPSENDRDERPRHRLTPRQRRAASHAGALSVSDETQLDVERGRVVARAVAPAQPRSQVDVDPEATRGVLGNPSREAIAERVTTSWQTIPHFAVTREIRADAILEIRATRTRSAALVPTVTDLLLIGLAHALRATGERGPIDVGLAVATPNGVLIPVIRDVLACSLREIAAARSAAIDRAREGRLSASEFDRPPRSSLSNLGPQGVDQFTGVIANGQTSLLTVGRIARRVVEVSGGIAVRPAFFATLNADHREMDGAEAALVLGAFADAITSVARLDREVWE